MSHIYKLLQRIVHLVQYKILQWNDWDTNKKGTIVYFTLALGNTFRDRPMWNMKCNIIGQLRGKSCWSHENKVLLIAFCLDPAQHAGHLTLFLHVLTPSESSTVHILVHTRAANRTVTAYGRTPTGRYGWVADHHPYRNIEPHIPIRYGMGGHTAVNGSIRAVQVL